MKQKRATPNHVLRRDWNAVFLPFLDADLALMEGDWMQYEKDPVIRSHYPPEQWVELRRATDRARAALEELAALHEVDLKADLQTDEEAEKAERERVTPLWMLAGPSNPERQRAEALRDVVDREMATVRRIVESVSEEDQTKALIDEDDAEYYKELIARERKDQADANARARDRDAWTARAAALDAAAPPPPALDEEVRRALRRALVRCEEKLARVQQWADWEDSYDDEFGPPLESGESTLARMRRVAPETRALLQQIAGWIGVRVPEGETPLGAPMPLKIPGFRKILARIDGVRSGDPAMERLFVLLSCLQANVVEIRGAVNHQPHLLVDDLERIAELAHLIPDQEDIQRLGDVARQGADQAPEPDR